MENFSIEKKPLLIFDGECAFCRKWIELWKRLTRGRVEYAPYQEAARQYPEISEKQFIESVWLVESGGKLSRSAEAVFRALRYARGQGGWLWFYERIPGFRWVTEFLYSLVAKNRTFFSKLTTLFWGKVLEASRYQLTSWIFLRSLGVIYVIAFISLWSQITGLVGERGILPASEFLERASEQAGALAYWLVPTLAWINSSDIFLNFICAAGTLFSFFLIFNLLPALSCFAAWVFYLSLFSIGQTFLSFQWDILLLETGFLAIFFSPLGLLPRGRRQEPSKIVLWLFRLLLFRLVFFSGAVKLLSGDATWKNLTALTVHYETQPLPTWTSWYMHQLPEWSQKLSTCGMFFVELIIPFLIFLPRRIRFFGSFTIILLQLLIISTGNYTFFNWLTIALCLLLFDDQFFQRRPAKKLVPTRQSDQKTSWPKWVTVPLLVALLIISAVPYAALFRRPYWLPVPVLALYQIARPLHLVNHYGLFAVMTTERPEIVLEGSEDEENWRPYEFRYKPGDLKRRPAFVAPHQPRLDWQMWFAALGRLETNPWVLNLGIRLLQGSPEVLRLFEKNPFENSLPRYVRAIAYDYQFTSFKEREETGDWWKRGEPRLYMPSISLREENEQ